MYVTLVGENQNIHCFNCVVKILVYAWKRGLERWRDRTIITSLTVSVRAGILVSVMSFVCNFNVTDIQNLVIKSTKFWEVYLFASVLTFYAFCLIWFKKGR